MGRKPRRFVSPRFLSRSFGIESRRVANFPPLSSPRLPFDATEPLSVSINNDGSHRYPSPLSTLPAYHDNERTNERTRVSSLSFTTLSLFGFLDDFFSWDFWTLSRSLLRTPLSPFASRPSTYPSFTVPLSLSLCSPSRTFSSLSLTPSLQPSGFAFALHFF